MSFEKIYVYSFPRSGTNLLASHLNFHPNIYSVNFGGGKQLHLTDEQIENRDNSILCNGVNFPKDEIKYVIYDEVNPRKGINENLDKKIVLIRDINSIKKSLNKMKSQMGSGFSYHVSSMDYHRLMTMGSREDVLTIQTETLILHYDEVMDMIYNYLELERPNIQEILDGGCHCGSKFEKRSMKDVYIGNSETWKFDRQYSFYYCPRHESALIAQGGTCPTFPMDKKRIPTDQRDWSVETMNELWNNPI